MSPNTRPRDFIIPLAGDNLSSIRMMRRNEQAVLQRCCGWNHNTVLFEKQGEKVFFIYISSRAFVSGRLRCNTRGTRRLMARRCRGACWYCMRYRLCPIGYSNHSHSSNRSLTSLSLLPMRDNRRSTPQPDPKPRTTMFHRCCP